MGGIVAVALALEVPSMRLVHERLGVAMGGREITGGLLLAAILTFGCSAPGAAQTANERPQVVFDRAVADFLAGRVAESVVGFDNVARLAPDLAPELWQRGIALYYVGRYADCRRQFESHRTVNPNDVENAAWHFLCVARAESPGKARAALLPVGPDARVPMRQVYQMLRGELKPEEVMAAAGDRPEAQFYAHLYVGLYFEALGNAAGALEHITAAASDRYEMGGYMHKVAKNHLALLRR
jgi:lipoprotein NlpI